MTRRRVAVVIAALDGVSLGDCLDVGCGWGFTLAALNRLGYKATGIDLVDDGFHAAYCVRSVNGLEFNVIKGDAARLPFKTESFSCVTAVEVLEHVYRQDRERLFRELYRVLLPAGILAISTPNYYSFVEFGKRVITKSGFLKRLAPYMHYPSREIRRKEYHPFTYHLPVRRCELETMVRAAGFDIIRTAYFLFVLKYAPDFAFRPLLILERILERVPLLRRCAATTLLVAVKPNK
jgi:2-polyprenyl-3-methyl-5-hydroxy-6-metoxy-1,4-benzoquinol methylase